MKIIKKINKPVLLKFLKKTKSGRYAEIEKSSLKYSRVRESVEIDPEPDSYYYSLG